MSFEWGEYKEAAGGEFLTELEKMQFVANGTPFVITAVREGETQFGTNFWVDIMLADGSERTISFKQGIAERDDRLIRLRETLASDPNAEIVAKMIKVGRRYDLTGA